MRRGGAGGEMTRKGGVGSPPQGPAILFLLLLHRPLLPSPLSAPPPPFQPLSPNAGGKLLRKKEPGNGKQPGTGREASSCETSAPGLEG